MISAAGRVPLLLLLCCLAAPDVPEAEVSWWRLGGPGGRSWRDWTELNVVVDDAAVPGSIQPMELLPDQNVVPRLGPWARWENPRIPFWRPGMPRIWRGAGEIYLGADWDPLLILDGDPTSGNVIRNFTFTFEFYTLDLGVSLPLDRFRFSPPEGEDELTGEPYRPGYALRNFEVSGGNDANHAASSGMVVEISQNVESGYVPLENLLAHVENNFAFEPEVRFPLQHLRFIRHKPFRDDLTSGVFLIERYGLAEIELYGRGFVPDATWISVPVDLGEAANVGAVTFGASRWRREGDELVEVTDGQATVKIDLKTGLDESPVAYYTYNDLGKQVETTAEEFAALQPRVLPHHPRGEGFRGPIGEDGENWSFWSAPLERSGDRPRLPQGRYFQIRARFKAEGLWEFARLESLAVETAPLLAARVRGETAVASDLEPAGSVAQVPAGELTEFIYEIGAEFSAAGQVGFDAVRLITPAAAEFLSLEMGDPLARAEPDSLVEEARGLTVYLPGRIQAAGEERLRIRLRTALFDAAGQFNAEVFERSGNSLPQAVEAGDVTAELGTNQLRVLVSSGAVRTVLDHVQVHPGVLTPQGDGVNDLASVAYSLFRVRAARVEVGVYALDGRRVRQLFSGFQSAGRQVQTWDGRDDQGQLLLPGLYLLRVKVDSDEGTAARLQPVAVVY